MIEDSHSDDRQLEEALRDAFPRAVVAPRDLAGRIRMTVHAEAAREPVRQRRSLVFRMSLSFACACMAGYVMSARIRAARSGADHGKSPYFATVPSTAAPGLAPAPANGRRLDNSPANEALARALPPPPVLASDTAAATPLRRVMEASPSIWTHEQSQVLAPVADAVNDESPVPSAIHISVTDPVAQQVRSLQLSRELRNGDVVYSDLHYTTRPILTSAGN